MWQNCAMFCMRVVWVLWLCGTCCSQAFCVHDGTWKDCGQHLVLRVVCGVSTSASVSWMCSEAAADQTRQPASRRRSAPSPVIHRRARCAISDLDRKLGAKLGANRKWKYLETKLKIYWKRVKTREPKSRWKKSKKAVPSLAIARSWDIVPDHGSKHTNFSGSPLRQTTLWNTQVWRM